MYFQIRYTECLRIRAPEAKSKFKLFDFLIVLKKNLLNLTNLHVSGHLGVYQLFYFKWQQIYSKSLKNFKLPNNSLFIQMIERFTRRQYSLQDLPIENI